MSWELVIAPASLLVGTLLGFWIERWRHRADTKEKIRVEKVAVYGRYLTVVRQSVTLLAAAMQQPEDIKEFQRIARGHEELVGPLRIYASDEVRDLVDELNIKNAVYNAQAKVAWTNKDPELLVRSWQQTLGPIVKRIEDAMRRDVGS